MKTITIDTGKEQIEANYTKSLFELIDGMFRDSTKPLLMEFHFMFRPTKISTKSREHRGRVFQLPRIGMLTFDKKMALVRRLDELPEESEIPTLFKEQYVLEVPYGMMGKFDNLKELSFR